MVTPDGRAELDLEMSMLSHYFVGKLLLQTHRTKLLNLRNKSANNLPHWDVVTPQWEVI